MVKVVVESFDVEAAEYLTPRNDVLSVRMTNGSMHVFDRQKDRKVIEAIEDSEVEILAFGAKEKLEAEKMREIAQEVVAKHEEDKHLEKVVKVSPPVEPNLVSLVVEAFNEEKPTVEVKVAEVLSPIVQLDVTPLVAEVDNSAFVPQVEVKVTPLEVVPEGGTTVMLNTPAADTANLVAVIPAESVKEVEKLEAAGVDITAAVGKVIEEKAVVVPEKVEEAVVMTSEAPPVEAPPAPEVIIPPAQK